MNDVTALEWRGYQVFCDNSFKALVLKNVTMGGGGVLKYQKCVTSFMEDPLSWNNRIVHNLQTFYRQKLIYPSHKQITSIVSGFFNNYTLIKYVPLKF